MKTFVRLLFVAFSAGTGYADRPPLVLTAPSRTPDDRAAFTLQAWPGDYLIRSATNLTGTWQTECEVPVDRSGSCYAAVPRAGRTSLFLRAQGRTPSDGAGCLAQFVTLGDAFSADVRCSGAEPQTFEWLWSDGTVSSDRPVAAITFGSATERTQGLRIEPATAIESINLGFDAADGGESTPLEHRPALQVAAVRFPYPLTRLRWWASSYNPITNTLDFSGFTRLEAIECYLCSPLRQVVVTNLPAIKRVCFEDCDLRELDLSGNPSLGDVRGALNAFTSIVTGRGTGPAVWHWCTRDNPQLTQCFQDAQTNFFSLREYYIWNDNQSGVLAPVSKVLSDLQAFNNRFTSADLSGKPDLWNINLSNNALTNLVLTGSTAIINLDAHGNRLPPDVLDTLLAALNASSPNLQTVDLSQNAGCPSATGIAYADSLAARGVRVQIDRPDNNDGRLEVSGGASAITFVTDSQHPHMEIRAEAAVATNIVWHWGDGTVSVGARLAQHDFRSAALHTNYVEVLPSGSVSYFGAQQGWTRQGIRAVLGCAQVPNLRFLYLYQESVTDLSVAGCSQLVQLHLADNPVSVSVCDQWFLDLDAAVPGPVAAADFYYPASQRSAASDAAWASLVNKGYSMHPF